MRKSFSYRQNKQRKWKEAERQKLETSLRIERGEIEPKTKKNLRKETQNEPKPKGKEIELGGSVLAEKHMKILDALLKAYEAILKLAETLE